MIISKLKRISRRRFNFAASFLFNLGAINQALGLELIN